MFNETGSKMFNVGTKVVCDHIESGNVVGEVVFATEHQIVVNWPGEHGIGVYDAEGDCLKRAKMFPASGYINVFRSLKDRWNFFVGECIYDCAEDAVEDASKVKDTDAYVATIEIEWEHN